MNPIDANALRMNLATVRTLDELLHVCGDAIERGFDKQLLAEMLGDVAQRHFDRYFLFSQAATSERHQWDPAWPDAANPKEATAEAAESAEKEERGPTLSQANDEKTHDRAVRDMLAKIVREIDADSDLQHWICLARLAGLSSEQITSVLRGAAGRLDFRAYKLNAAAKEIELAERQPE